MTGEGLVLRLLKGTHENSKDIAGQESVRLRKKGKVGKKGKNSKESLSFSLFSLCYTRV
jgi:hypothetical protein